MPSYAIQEYLNWAVQRVIEVGGTQLKKEFKPEGFEFIIMVLPYHKTQVRHLSSEQIALMERKVALAAQQELKKALEEKGRGREI